MATNTTAHITIDKPIIIDRIEIADVVNTFVLSLEPDNGEFLLLPSQLRNVLKLLNLKYSNLGGHDKYPVSKVIYEDAVDFLTGSGWQQDHELRYGKREYFVKPIRQP